MKTPAFRKTVAALLAAACATLTVHASTFTVGGSGNNFIITRTGDTSAAETVRYRTVSLSALAGQHFTDKSGLLTFAPGETSTNISVSTRSPSNDAYKFQNGASRSYRFEVTDEGGFMLDSKDRTITTGTSVPSSGAFNATNVTVASAEFLNTDSGYANNACKTAASSTFFSKTAPQTWFQQIAAELRMTLSLDVKEKDDGYQYIQILVENTSTCDDRSGCSNGNPGNISLSRYMAGFGHNPGSKDANYASYSFPLTNYGNNCGNVSNPWGNSISSTLYDQKFNTGCRSSSDGRLILPTGFTNLVVRFNASGDNNDDWYAKNVVARIQAVDTTRPTRLGDPVLAAGRHAYGNTAYISIAFSEIVKVSGTPTLATTWGTLNYTSGSGSNVLTFKGDITANVGTALTVNSLSGTIKDLAGNSFATPATINKTISGATVEVPWPGSGTAADPYVIVNTLQLDWLAKETWGGYYGNTGGNNFSGKYFKLGADIAYSHSSADTWDKTTSFTSNFTSIGGWGHSFKGSFDGDGHTVSGIRIYKSGTADEDQCQGLFGMISTGSMVKNLVLYDANVVGYKQVGGIVGSHSSGIIQDCYVYSTRAKGTDNASPQQGIIRGSGNSTVTRAYYKDCMVDTAASQHNIVKLTLNDNVTIARVPATAVNANVTTYADGATIGGEEYYSPDATITLGYSGSVPQGSFAKYTASTSSGDITHANIDGNVLTMPDADVAVTASVEPITYTVRFHKNDGGDATADQSFTYGVAQALDAPFTRDGYTFAEWNTAANGDSTAYANGQEIVNLTSQNNFVFDLYAQWTINTYNLTCNLAGGSVATSNPETYTVETSTFTLVNPTREHFTFAGWIGTGLAEPTMVVTIAQGSTGDRSYTATWTPNTAEFWGDGDGSAQTPYVITTTLGLDMLATVVNEGNTYEGTYFELGADIVYDSTASNNYTPIGKADADNYPFKGVFDGKGHAVSGIRVSSDIALKGLFGCSLHGTVRNVILTDANFSNGECIGGIVGLNQGAVENCLAIDVTVAGGQNRGAIVGQSAGTVVNSYYRNCTVGGETSLTNAFTVGVGDYVTANIEDYSAGVEYNGVLYAPAAAVVSLTLGTTAPAGFVFEGFTATAGALSGAGSSYTLVMPSVPARTWDADGDGSIIVDPETGDAITTCDDTPYPGVMRYNPDEPNVIYVFEDTDGDDVPDTWIPHPIAWEDIDGDGLLEGGIDRDGDGHIDDVDGDNNTQQVPGGDPDNDPSDGNPNNPSGKDAILIHYDSDGDGDVDDDDDWCQLQKNPDTGVITPAREPVSDVGEVVPADVTINATFSVPYIDADGNQQMCTDYTVIESSNGDIEYGNNDGSAWYVISGDVTINGTLALNSFNSHLILCDGATLTINQTSSNDGLYGGNLSIYGQSAGSGRVNSTATWNGINANNALTINGGIISATSTTSHGIFAGWGNITINRGSVTAQGHYNGIRGQNFIINGGTVNATNGEGNGSYGICASGDNIILGWTNATDRITASSYYAEGTISVKDGQVLTDGTAGYSGTLNDAQIAALAGKTLQPCFMITLPEHVVATSGVISQEGTTAYALPGAAVTLAPAEGYEITSGDTSFTMPAQNVVSDVTVQIITYRIYYDIDGGSVATPNPETYTVETPTFTLVNPTRDHFTFMGWTGTGLAEPTTTVTIAQGSTGNRSYIATLTPNIAEFWGSGDGSQERPYIINDTIGLNMLATLVNESRIEWNKYFELGADIQYDNTVNNNFKPIGNGETDSAYFGEVLDGKGHSISGIRVSGTTVQGLIGWSWCGTVKNVILTDASFSDGECAGGIVGNNDQGTVENCLVIDVAVPGGQYDGAVVGYNQGGTVVNSYYRNCTVGDSTNQSNCYTITGGENVNATINSYDQGVMYNGTLYAPENAAVSLTLGNSAPAGFLFDHYTASVGTLTGTENPYTLTMPSEDVAINASFSVPYIDADGNQQTCSNFTIINSDYQFGDYFGTATIGELGITEQWFAVIGTVNVSSPLSIYGRSHLILCDGAALNIICNNSSGEAFHWPDSLAIYGQSLGTGTLNVQNSGPAIYTSYPLTINGGTIIANSSNSNGFDLSGGASVTINGGTVSLYGTNYGFNIDNGPKRSTITINGGTVTANGTTYCGFYIGNGDLTLGYTDLTDRITANSYRSFSGTISVKDGQFLTDGTAGYTGTLSDTQINALAGKTLQPCFSITLPALVVATGVISQDGTTAYALPGETITLASATTGKPLANVTVNGNAATDNGDGTWSFEMPAGNVTVKGYVAIWDGSGTAEAPYIITTPAELDMLATIVNSGIIFDGTYFELGNDITYAHTSDWDDTTSVENNYTPIGYDGGTFLGIFDGKGHAISGIRIYTDYSSMLGLFGVTYHAVIRNITLTDTRIALIGTGANVGGIVGVNQGTVENCHVANTVNIHNAVGQVGGIVGYNTGDSAIVKGCTSSVKLTIGNGNYDGTYGGIVGVNSGTIENCLAINVINECTNNSGPIVGINTGTVVNSHYRNCTVAGEANLSDVFTVSHATTVTMAPAGDAIAAYDYDGIAVYSYGLAYGGTLYVPAAATVSLTLGNAAPAGIVFDGYTASAGTLTGTENPYTLTMPSEDVTIGAAFKVPYIDENGDEQYCSKYTVIESGESDVTLGVNGQDGWYVVSGNVTINGQLALAGSTINVILCDGATLTVNNSSGHAVNCSNALTIYSQSAGTGTLNATTTKQSYDGIRADGHITINGGIVNASSANHNGIYASDGNVTINGGVVTATAGSGTFSRGIYAKGNVTINGGIVTAIGTEYGIYAYNGNITIGWANPTDRITASRYYSNVTIMDDQAFTDGTAVYTDSAGNTALAGKTLQPCFSLTLPPYVTATGVISQDGTTAYALPGETITLASATTGKPLVNVTVNGNAATDNGDGTWSFEMPASNVIVNGHVAIWDGNGTAEAPYIITTPAELDMLATIVNSGETFNGTYFELGNDIAYAHTSDWDDTSSTENNYTPISGRNSTVFKGAFDGKGYTISGIRIYDTHDIQGLFGMAQNGAVVKNITLADARIVASGNFNGGIVGYAGGIVDNCHVTSTVNIHNPQLNAGGIVGFVSGIIRGCTSSAKLTRDDQYHFNYGGIAGQNESGTIENCLAINVINECTNHSGPIVGYNHGTVTNSYYRNCTVAGEANLSDVFIVSHANNVTLTVNSYDKGIVYDGTLYALEGAVLSLDLGFTGNPNDMGGYMVSAGTLTGEENPYTLTMPNEDVHISARMIIPYIDANGQTAYCTNYTILNGSTEYSSYGEDGVEAWYVVDHDVTYTDDVSFSGTANLILVDGATLTLNPGNSGSGITMSTSNDFNIYVQSAGTGGVYTMMDGGLAKSSGTSYNRLSFTGDATIILQDDGNLDIGEAGVIKGGEKGLFVSGSLTIYGQAQGWGTCYATTVQAGGNIAIYGGEVYADGLTANNGEGSITLGWTGLKNCIYCQDYVGKVNLARDFMSVDFTSEEYDILNAGRVDDLSAINGFALYPYAKTLNVSYIDENGETHTANATVLWGNETNLVGGVYTAMYECKFDHGISFSGDTTLIVPDDVSIRFINDNWEEGVDGITVNGKLSVYGQTQREGELGVFVPVDGNQAAIRASGDVTFGNVYAYTGPVVSGGDVLIAGGHCIVYGGIFSNGGSGTITLGYLTPDDYITSMGYAGTVVVRAGQTFIDNDGNTYSGTLNDDQIAAIKGKGISPYIPSQNFTDPEGRAIEDQALVEWLSANNFTQSDINALGSDAAATDKLYECWLLNCSITAANPGGALSITGFAVSNNEVSVTVQLVRQSPLGYINGALYLYGANNLSVGFGDRPISEEIVDFRDGDSIFDTLPASGLVTQTVTATFDASIVTETFFKAKIEFPRSDEPDEPWEPDPEEVEE